MSRFVGVKNVRVDLAVERRGGTKTVFSVVVKNVERAWKKSPHPHCHPGNYRRNSRNQRQRSVVGPSTNVRIYAVFGLVRETVTRYSAIFARRNRNTDAYAELAAGTALIDRTPGTHPYDGRIIPPPGRRFEFRDPAAYVYIYTRT